MKDTVSLEKLFAEGKLNDSPHISHVVEVLLLSLPHNMVVESGFSKMKTVESIYQSRMDAATYDARRIICSHFDRKNFEAFQASQNLMKMISQASAQYKLLQKKKSTIELPQPLSSSKERVTGVYKRRTTQTVDKELGNINEELAAPEQAVEEIRAKKLRLQSERESKMSHLDSDSQKIIDSMFAK